MVQQQTKFGLNQVSNTTPRWVQITFNIIVALAATATFIIGSTNRLTDATKVELLLYISGGTYFLHYIAKMVGIEITEPTWGKK